MLYDRDLPRSLTISAAGVGTRDIRPEEAGRTTGVGTRDTRPEEAGRKAACWMGYGCETPAFRLAHYVSVQLTSEPDASNTLISQLRMDVGIAKTCRQGEKRKDRGKRRREGVEGREKSSKRRALKMSLLHQQSRSLRAISPGATELGMGGALLPAVFPEAITFRDPKLPVKLLQFETLFLLI